MLVTKTTFNSFLFSFISLHCTSVRRWYSSLKSCKLPQKNLYYFSFSWLLILEGNSFLRFTHPLFGERDKNRCSHLNYDLIISLRAMKQIVNNLNTASLISLFESHLCFKKNIYIQDFKNCVLSSAHFLCNFSSLMCLTVLSLLRLQKGQKCVFLTGVASRIQLSFVPVWAVHGAAKYPQRLRQWGLNPLQIHWDGFQGEGSRARSLLQEWTASRVRYVTSETLKRSKDW